MLVTRTATPVDLMVVTAPFMSFRPLTRRLHLAASDAIFPIAALQMLAAYRRAAPRTACNTGT